MLFPLHVKRIIFCFVYSEDYHPVFIYPSLEETETPQPCAIDVDLISSSQLSLKNESCIPIPLAFDHFSDFVEIEIDSKYTQTSVPVVTTAEPFHQHCIPYEQPTAFQAKIRMKMFRPLKLPHPLHPYPLDCYGYLPCFSGENQASAERHVESFLDFADRFSIAHEDVIMRMFSKSLIKDTAAWFKSLRADSIGSWTEFSNVFLKYWGKYKSLDSYLADFYALKREQDEALPVFNRRFYRAYHDMPLEVRPTETAAMIYYVMGLHSDLVLLLLERKSSSLTQLFEDAQEVEENIHLSRRIRDRDFLENLQVHEQAECQYTSDSEHESYELETVLEQQRVCELFLDSDLNFPTVLEYSRDSALSSSAEDCSEENNKYETDKGQQPEGEYISDSESDSSVCAEYSRDRYDYEVYDQFVNQNEPMITNDCIENYMFLADHNPCHLNIALSSSTEDCSEENSKFEADVDQQPEGEYISDSESDFSVCIEYSRVRYEFEFHNQFANQEEPMVTDNYIGNYMFSVDQNSYDVKHVLSSSFVHLSEEEVTIIDDQSLISKGQEDDQSSYMAEQEVTMDMHLFPEEQHVSYFLFKDPVAAFMDLYFSKNLKISDFLSWPVFLSKYDFLKSSLSLWLHVQHHLLISNKDKISSVFKLLGWLLWKSTFT
jgi:hypothetical protein